MTLEERKTAAEIANLRAARRKALAEAKNAEYQAKEAGRRRNIFERILSTTQATVGLALVTLLFQIGQFGYTSSEQRKADESKQWKEAIKDVNFKGDYGPALNVETFLPSKAYGYKAEVVIASMLPYLLDTDAFDHLFYAIERRASWKDDDIEIYNVAKAVSVDYWIKADPVYAANAKAGVPPSLWGRFHEELSNVILRAEPGKDDNSVEVRDARRREWELDTMTHGLLDFWREHGTHPHAWLPAAYSIDLQTVIFRFDNDAPVTMQGLDLRQAFLKGAYLHRALLDGARLDRARLIDADMEYAELYRTSLDDADVTGANLGEVGSFAGSSWKNVEWWRAARLSDALCQWLPTQTQFLKAGTTVPARVEACFAKDAPAPVTAAAAAPGTGAAEKP